ncbi:MAG: outer membrane lipoprotein carrier protein LolA [Bacteroidetes bacterium]|nr:MAG: outer membrane lipoprotein carrier protein LolA [Bacteroidota bacterium]
MKKSRRMKSTLSLFLLLFISTGLFAQTGQVDKKAKEILDGVSAKYKSFKSLKAHFTISVENPKDKKKDVQKGSISLKGSSYKLEIAGQDVISDGKTRWTFLKDANEIQIDNLKVDENSITPTNVFTLYEKGWNSKFTGEIKKGNISYQLIELVPIDPKSKNIFKVKLTINKLDKFIASAQIFDKNGSIQTITVETFSPNTVNDDTVFSFNAGKYPGAEVIDLR